MSGPPNTAHQERADLLHYTASIVSLLTEERVLSEADQYGYKKDYVYRSIGQLAHHLACVGEEDKSHQLADTLLVAVDADQEGTLLTWSTMAENGVKVAEHRIRNSMGLIYGEDGSTVIPEGIDIHDGWTFMNLLSLYRFGDKSVAPYLWRCVEELDEQHLSIGAHFAVRIYDAGDESAYNLIKSAAERAC